MSMKRPPFLRLSKQMAIMEAGHRGTATASCLLEDTKGSPAYSIPCQLEIQARETGHSRDSPQESGPPGPLVTP